MSRLCLGSILGPCASGSIIHCWRILNLCVAFFILHLHTMGLSLHPMVSCPHIPNQDAYILGFPLPLLFQIKALLCAAWVFVSCLVCVPVTDLLHVSFGFPIPIFCIVLCCSSTLLTTKIGLQYIHKMHMKKSMKTYINIYWYLLKGGQMIKSFTIYN